MLRADAFSQSSALQRASGIKEALLAVQGRQQTHDLQVEYMKCYIHNTSLPGYDNDIRALVLSFYPGAEVVFTDADGSADIQADNSTADRKPYRGEASECVCHAASGADNAERTQAIRRRDNKDDGNVTAEGKTLAGSIYIDMDKLAPKVERDVLRFNEKTNLKRVLYTYLSELSGRQLPWGTLTGIRPVRILEMIDPDGSRAREELDSELKSRFLISDRKIALMQDIHDREQRVLSRVNYREGCSIYIGIPFCPTRCIYCSFASNQLKADDDRPDRYVDAVCRELEALCRGSKDSEHAHFDKRQLQTLYIGGGTPTALNERQLERLLDKVAELFGVPYEYTVEAGRPDSITAAKLDIIKAHGVHRISVNPQSFNQKTLELIGRRHTVRETVEAYELARSKGFDNINMDIIMGLPGENIDDVRHTLKVIEELKPDSLTVHALAVKRASRLSTEGKAYTGLERKGSSPDASEADELAGMTELGAECAERLGMHPYYLYRQKNMAGNQDNVGYAASGRECLYNILMMEEKHTVYGIGAGASTKVVLQDIHSGKRVVRSENVKNLDEYLRLTFTE